MMKSRKLSTEIYINNMRFVTRPDISILEASSLIGFNISRFCYHESLSVAGNCRICLVEVEKSLRPAASCALPIINNMRIHIDTPLVKKARESVLETLLLNHPLDCPICDQAGECDLQDLTKIFGGIHSRALSRKRVIEDKKCGVLIKTIMTRCIHCTRCVRFISEITGSPSLGTFNRGTSTEIGGYASLTFDSELTGNVIDLCPVGALTSKSYAFKSRPWGMKVHESIDLSDSTGINTYVHLKDVDVLRVLPKKNDEINGNFISDKSRFSYDANKETRIQVPTSRKKFNESWEEFLKEIDYALKNTSRNVLIVVNNELDLEAMDSAKKLSYRAEGRISVKTLDFTSCSSDSFFEMCSASKISDIAQSDPTRKNFLLKPYTRKNKRRTSQKELKKETQNKQNEKPAYCFLLSCNLRLESSILNGKLRSRYRKYKLDVYCIGQPFLTNLKTKFVSIGVLDMVTFFEGKLNCSRKFLDALDPLVFIGESLKKRFDPISYFICFLKKVVSSAMIFSIESSCNSKGASLMNMESLTSVDVDTSDILVFVNIDDTLTTRDILEGQSNKDIYWLSTHGSQIAYNGAFILPTKSVHEIKGVYLNLEGRPQKTFKTSAKTGQRLGLRSANAIFQSILSDNLIEESFAPSPFLDHVFEMVKSPKKFAIQKNLLCNVKSESSANLVLEISSYPLISFVEDFYTKGKFTKKSTNMMQSSQESRKNTKRF